MMITSSYTLYGATAMFVYPMGKIVGDFGCYFVDGLVTYYVGLISTNSFYVTLFRYLCIVHHTNSNGIISFEVRIDKVLSNVQSLAMSGLFSAPDLPVNGSPVQCTFTVFYLNTFAERTFSSKWNCISELPWSI